jgi:protein-S-isoprenylcysteine O-methyltransferase Ste14
MSAIRTFLLLVLAGYASLSCFGFRHRRGSGLQSVLLLSTLVSLAFYAYHVAGMTFPLRGFQYAGLCGLTLSIALLGWAVRSHRTRPGAAFAGYLPVAVVRHGPYRIVRHPIYTSYLLATLSGVAIVARAELIAIPIWMFVLYHIAARREEGQILESPLRQEYLDYTSQAGMFFPRLTACSRLVTSGSTTNSVSHEAPRHDVEGPGQRGSYH